MSLRKMLSHSSSEYTELFEITVDHKTSSFNERKWLRESDFVWNDDPFTWPALYN